MFLGTQTCMHSAFLSVLMKAYYWNSLDSKKILNLNGNICLYSFDVLWNLRFQKMLSLYYFSATSRIGNVIHYRAGDRAGDLARPMTPPPLRRQTRKLLGFKSMSGPTLNTTPECARQPHINAHTAMRKKWRAWFYVVTRATSIALRFVFGPAQIGHR